MAGIELDLIKSEIYKYLGIPYWSNKLKDGVIIEEGILGGKGTCEQIAQATIDIAKTQKIDLLKLDSIEIHNFQKKNHIGIDCSGLVYHLVDKLYFYKTGSSVFDHLVGTDNQHGPRRVSSNLFTDKINARKIDDYNDIKTGDLIRINQGRHVIFIINKEKNQINYVHSSDKTKISGVHLGQVTIVDPQKPLNFQLWSDQIKDGKNYVELIHPKKGDGIYRLLLLD